MLEYALAGEFIYHVSGYLYAKVQNKEMVYDPYYLLIMCVAMTFTAIGFCIVQPAASVYSSLFFGLTANSWVHRIMDMFKLILTF